MICDYKFFNKKGYFFPGKEPRSGGVAEAAIMLWLPHTDPFYSHLGGLRVCVCTRAVTSASEMRGSDEGFFFQVTSSRAAVLTWRRAGRTRTHQEEQVCENVWNHLCSICRERNHKELVSAE